MYNNQQPMDTIKAWQNWYHKNQRVSSMTKPMVTKDSKEKLHNTVGVVTTLIEAEAIKKATEYFADTITEYSCELDGVQLYNCLLTAAQNNLKHTEEEYKKAKQLIDLLQNQNNEN
jgi:hypothetical protein